jgi:pyruvate/oxaloacetate carboxyltransferase
MNRLEKLRADIARILDAVNDLQDVQAATSLTTKNRRITPMSHAK